jgi:hypothetical protein
MAASRLLATDRLRIEYLRPILGQPAHEETRVGQDGPDAAGRL